jgi:pentapeptide MXKDX repeat protein
VQTRNEVTEPNLSLALRGRAHKAPARAFVRHVFHHHQRSGIIDSEKPGARVNVVLCTVKHRSIRRSRLFLSNYYWSDVMKKLAVAALATMFLSVGTAALAQDKGAMSKDEMSKHAMHEDAMSKDAMSHDTMSKDAMHKDAMSHDTMSEDAMHKDTMKKGSE